LGGIGQPGSAGAVGNGRSGAAAEDFRAKGKVEFIHEAGAEERAIQFAAALADEASDVPFLAQPSKRAPEVNFGFAEGSYLVCQGAEFLEPARAGACSRENDDRREALLKDLGIGVHGAGAADDDPQVVFGQAGAKTMAAVFSWTGPEVDGIEVHSAGACDDGVSGCAEFKQVVFIPLAAKGGDGAVGGGDFAVGCDGHVDKNEGA
jgi:hypothetical protein